MIKSRKQYNVIILYFIRVQRRKFFSFMKYKYGQEGIVEKEYGNDMYKKIKIHKKNVNIKSDSDIYPCGNKCLSPIYYNNIYDCRNKYNNRIYLCNNKYFSHKCNSRAYKKSVFYEEVNEKNNCENNLNLLNIIKNSNIEKFNIYDCTLFLNYFIKNKKNKEFDKELKDRNKIKLSSSLYKESNDKILKNILNFEPQNIFFFFNKYAELRDRNSIEILFGNIIHNHLNYFSLYYLTDIIYNIAILNCNFKNNQDNLYQFLNYIIFNVIKENKNIKHFEKKVTNKLKISFDIIRNDDKKKKPIYIKSIENNKEKKKNAKGNFLQNKGNDNDTYIVVTPKNGSPYMNEQIKNKNIKNNNINNNNNNNYYYNSNCIMMNGSFRENDIYNIDLKNSKFDHNNNLKNKIKSSCNNNEDNNKSKFSINTLSNIMLYKLIYSLAKIKHNEPYIKELFILLIPYIRYLIQNKNYIYSKDRNDVLVKIIWSFAFLKIRDIHLFVDFSISIQLILYDLKLEYLKIIKKIYENLLIFDETLLDKLDARINQIEENAPEQFSYPRKKQFKKKKKRIHIGDEIKFDKEKK
ncbi:hypothetical protein PGSY75_0107100 [Plasmodium gaboni]|uniref:Uncharacterized protein n=1 Tax=Plasmodium gaboni TaxID=647221 RepID=A0A151LX20_9APIC|nr:hypothetical protein PGSY75_0107100 [Plasmodium gaboni]KYO03716.1 hypothetical protein PGSY75_0107100 [Plasmodium gaboni]